MITIAQPENKFFKQKGTITLQFSAPHIKNDLVKFITQNSKLYFGNLHKSVFDINFQKLKKHYFQNQLTQITSTSIDTVQPSAFNLYMTRLAANQQWRWPAMATELRQGLYFSAGNSRLLASGISKANPHDCLKVLILQKTTTPADYFLNNPIEITNDQLLHQVLGLNYTHNVCDSEIVFGVEQIIDQDQIKFSLTTIYDGNTEHHYYAGAEHLAKYHGWLWKYGKNPVLNIYTNWPSMISDSSGQWNINFSGPSSHTKTENFKLGHLEAWLTNEANKTILQKEHGLYITSPRPLDVANLLCWVDLDYNCWIDQNLDFALFRNDTQYNTRLIHINP